jgi:hypothetical protein
VPVDLVLELVAGPAGACTGRIAALDHEAGDDAVEDDAVVEAVPGELDEVRDGLGSVLLEELEFDRAVVRVQRHGSHIVSLAVPRPRESAQERRRTRRAG